MRCERCERENRADSRFCLGCGAPLARTCSCGRELPPDAAFCDGCGAAVAEPAAAPATSGPPASEPRERSPLDYTPRHLAERILTSRSALEGERKQVTVLFADVKGSQDLAAETDPEEWHRILDRFFQILNEGIHRFEGSVNQYTGDGIMALFGAPIAHEDHAQRACYAALRLAEDLRGYADELRLERGLNFSVRMGINSGEVVVGAIGDDLRMDYTAQGHTVGLAQRMEQLAESGRAYLSQHTAKLVEGYFELRDLGPMRVKGSTEPVEVYELQGIGRIRTRLEVSAARGFSKFVGRGDEMQTLGSALARAEAGEGQVIGVVAEAGTGKSRLCYEFAERSRARGVRVRQAQALPHGKLVPFLPILQLLRDVFEIDEDDSPSVVRSKAAGALLLLDRELESELPLVFDLLGAPDPDRPSPSLPPAERQARLLAVLQRLIEGAPDRPTVVILIEDLHWIDSATESFLESAVETAARTRTMLLLNFRPEYRAAWMQRSSYQQVPLRPLTSDDCAELIGYLLGKDPSLDGLPARIEERTRGNPFYIEEIVRSLAEEGRIEGARGSYRLVGDIADAALPASVQAVLAARIDRLDDRDKHVMHAAAVIGERFGEAMLVEIASQPERAIRESLQRLTAAEFLVQEALHPEPEYAFRHPLTQEVAYRSQLSDARAELHAAVARALEARESGDGGEEAARIAHHWEGAGDASAAARGYRRAAEWAGLAHAREAYQYWSKVGELADSLPESQERDDLGAYARAQLLSTGARLGAGADEMAALYEEGCALARRSGNQPALALLLSQYGNFRYQTRARVDEVFDDVWEAIRLADALGDADLRVATRYNATMPTIGRDADLGFRILDEALELLAERPDAGASILGTDPAMMFLFLRAFQLSIHGRVEELGDVVDELERRVEANPGNPLGRVLLLHGRSRQATSADDLARAVDAARETVAIAGEFSMPSGRVIALSLLGDAYLAAGEAEESATCQREALRVLREIGSPRNIESLALCGLARALTAAGDGKSAVAGAREAVKFVVERGQTASEATARNTLAEALLAEEGVSARRAVEAELEAVARIERERTTSPLQSLLALEIRADLARQLGDAEASEVLLRTALARYRALDLTGPARRVKARLERDAGHSTAAPNPASGGGNGKARSA